MLGDAEFTPNAVGAGLTLATGGIRPRSLVRVVRLVLRVLIPLEPDVKQLAVAFEVGVWGQCGGGVSVGGPFGARDLVGGVGVASGRGAGVVHWVSGGG